MAKITQTSKLILSLILEKVKQTGEFRLIINYNSLMQELSINDENYFMACMKYLYESGYLKFHNKTDDGCRYVEMTVNGINFVEAE